MIVVGLTGSIGMGKTTAAGMLRRLGLPVYDADAAVHAVMAPGGEAVAPVEAAFPGVLDPGGGIDRKKLAERVFVYPDQLRKLEAIIHPIVGRLKRKFLAGAQRRRVPAVILDVPLLFESRGERFCAAILLVSSPAFLQRQRVLKRPGMTEQRFAAILARQMPDREKRRRATVVIPTGLGKRETLHHLRKALRVVGTRSRNRKIVL